MPTIIAPDILLPNKNVDLYKWAVIACDQFTGRINYWEELKGIIKDAPSALHLTLPEIYLTSDNSEKIKSINKTMQSYLSSKIFDCHKNCMILTERKTAYNNRRLGLVLAVDLEEYSFTEKAKIRATEGTIIERIPPRVEIRGDAQMEFSHIMLLIDDRRHKIIENLYGNKGTLKKIYDFNLNMDGGHISGYLVEKTKTVIDSLNALIDDKEILQKYGKLDKLLFAVGDGNHSLATAKTVWDNLKSTLSEKERANHPSRYALCEVVNIHDDGLKFEPIHRVLYNIDGQDFCKKFKKEFKDEEALGKIYFNGISEVKFPFNSALCYKKVQNFIDAYIKELGGQVDYIHGETELEEICKTKNAVGIFMPKLKKDEFFSYIINYGTLERKSFSMGEAKEKRYYLEARKIKG
ncbi:MAG: DUF1015 domain-containing protein [Firmicutes bacterium]|nr:DUF1015 domain-containing protein [Bacillota bacterium]